MQPQKQSTPPSQPQRAAAPDLHAKRTPGPHQQQLAAFLGAWKLTGTLAGSDAPVVGRQVYELLPGNFFIAGHWDRKFGDVHHIGTSILGYQPDTRTLFAHNFDNLGYARKYVLSLSERTWKFSGQFERATIEFAADGNSFTEVWHRSKDGKTWTPLCNLEGRRHG